MRVTLTNADTAYPAPARTVGGIKQHFKRCMVVNLSGAEIKVANNEGLVGGSYPETGGLPIAAGDKVVIPTQEQLWMASETAGVTVDYEYFS